MGILKRFNEILGLKDDLEAEKRRFVERVNQVIFHTIDTVEPDIYDYELLIRCVCFDLGVNFHDLPRRRVGVGMYEKYVPATLRTLTSNDFIGTLGVLCALYERIDLESDHSKGQKWLSDLIEATLSKCTCDIGVRWKDGFFYPAGAEELDKHLIEETLTWLKDYPDERRDYWTALQSYAAGDSLADVIKNCYSAIEGVARKILGNQRTLDNNKDELLAKINLSDGWKSLLANYITYAHDYRHASEGRHEIKKQEAEAYLYMTGLIMRLTIQSK